jgi:hypothetical protein
MQEHYIRLLTTIELSSEQKNVWYRVVEKFLGDENHPEHENFIDQMASQRDEFQGDEDFPYVYVLYLDCDIDVAAAEQVVMLWSEVYPLDYEIETSADIEDACGCEGCGRDCHCNDIEIDEAMREEIQLRASKFLHNRWVESQLQSGWRFGMKMNEAEQTDPRLRNWDSLNEQYRKTVELSEEQAVKFLKKHPELFV